MALCEAQSSCRANGLPRTSEEKAREAVKSMPLWRIWDLGATAAASVHMNWVPLVETRPAQARNRGGGQGGMRHEPEPTGSLQAIRG